MSPDKVTGAQTELSGMKPIDVAACAHMEQAEPQAEPQAEHCGGWD